MGGDSDYIIIKESKDLARLSAEKVRNSRVKNIFVYVSGMKLFEELLSNTNLISSFLSLAAFRQVDIEVTLLEGESLNWAADASKVSALKRLLDHGVFGKIGKQKLWLSLNEFASHASVGI